MANSMAELTLTPNTDYTSTTMTACVGEDKFKISRTSAKMIFVEKDDGSERRFTLKKIDAVIGDPSGFTVKEDIAPEHNDMGFGILSNTDYAGTGTIVVHKNTGDMELVRTSEKMLFVLNEDGDIKRMKLNMMVGTSQGEAFKDLPSEDALDMEEEVKIETEDPFFDNDFAEATMQNDTTDTGVVFD